MIEISQALLDLDSNDALKVMGWTDHHFTSQGLYMTYRCHVLYVNLNIENNRCAGYVAEKRGKTYMKLIALTKENLEKEHICCAISNNKDCQVASKKAWLGDRLDEGLVFLKGDVRGKCFIEYIPAESAWVPVKAPGYMYIDCFWVSGKFKGQGYSSQLLEECIRDSREKGKKGLVVLSSAKKRPFLMDPGYLKYKGFETVDTAEPFYELMYLPFTENVDKPAFMKHAKKPHVDEKGYVAYYTNQCPFTAKYIPILEAAALKNQVPWHSVKIETAEQAQSAPAPFTSFSLFYDGEFVTNEILSEKKFESMIQKKN